MLKRISAVSGRWSAVYQRSVSRLFRFTVCYVDLMVAPWLLGATAFHTYLAARIVSLAVPLALYPLGQRTLVHLVILAQPEPAAPFRAAAARVNLGYLMVSAATALFVLTLAPLIARGAAVPEAAFRDILIWLLIGQCAPVLFGATGVLMRVVERGAFYEVLRGMTACLFLGGIVMVGDTDGVLTAQTLATAQLTHAAICAMLLTQCGVWPGLTALLHKEIKLF